MQTSACPAFRIELRDDCAVSFGQINVNSWESPDPRRGCVAETFAQPWPSHHADDCWSIASHFKNKKKHYLAVVRGCFACETSRLSALYMSIRDLDPTLDRESTTGNQANTRAILILVTGKALTMAGKQRH